MNLARLVEQMKNEHSFYLLVKKREEIYASCERPPILRIRTDRNGKDVLCQGTLNKAMVRNCARRKIRESNANKK